ncbi:MAG: hypothetical protein AAFX99_19465 [Myxococcota bacterium]
MDFEEFNQDQYAPYAKKYNLSQEPRKNARIRASLPKMVADVFSDDMAVMEILLDRTIAYMEKLKKLQSLAPQEDSAFFAYVVEQEELQVKALTLRVEGKIEESTALLRRLSPNTVLVTEWPLITS